MRPLGAAWVLAPALPSAWPWTWRLDPWGSVPSSSGSVGQQFQWGALGGEAWCGAQISVPDAAQLGPLLRKSKKEEKGLMSAFQEATCVNTASR